jgi:hypothetical protein
MARDDQVDIRVRLRGAREAGRETRSLSRDIDELGDQAGQAARKLGAMSAASSSARLNIGPLSTNLRGAALGVGALTLATGKLLPATVAVGEAVAHLVGGAGAGAGVGLLALFQGSKVAQLGLEGLGDALGGNEEAAKNLSPELRELLFTLQDAQRTARDTAQAGLLPGVMEGADSAMRNLPVVNRIIGETAQVLGNLAAEAGDMAASRAWGRDVGRVGRRNARILDDLGHSGLNLADGLRHVVVEAGPLAEWMAEGTRSGTELAETWALNARQSGDMARFFREARRDLELLASAGGHGGRGIINLFGSQDVDGTETLRNLDAILARFEAWSRSPAVRESLGDAIVAEIPQAVAAGMDAIARNLPAAAGTAAKVFWEAFWDSSLGGKGLMAAALFAKFGGFKALGKAIGGGLGLGGGLGGGSKKFGGAVPVWVVNQAGVPSATPDGRRTRGGRILATAGTIAGAAAIQHGVNEALKDEGVIPRDSSAPARVGGHDPNRPIWENATDLIGSLFGGDDGGEHVTRQGARETDPFRRSGAFEPVFENHISINMNGRPIEKQMQRQRARRRAREARRG